MFLAPYQVSAQVHVSVLSVIFDILLILFLLPINTKLDILASGMMKLYFSQKIYLQLYSLKFNMILKMLCV